MLTEEQREFLDELKRQIGAAIQAKTISQGMGGEIPPDPASGDRPPSPTHFFTSCGDFEKPDNQQSGPGGILG